MKPRLLDLFGGAQGAAVGYARAGFDVTTVDREFHKGAPLPQLVADVRTVLAQPRLLESFDVITASPPCQSRTRAGHLRTAQGKSLRAHGEDMIDEVREALERTGKPYVIENVPKKGASLGTPYELVLCGSSFGLKVRRHRVFGSNMSLWGLQCDHAAQGRPVGVYGSLNDDIPDGGRTARTLAEARDAMGIDWMGWADITEAIPPAMTQHLGVQLRAVVQPGEALRPFCERCGTLMPVPDRAQGGGRTKRYCSGRCRTAAHRSRPASWGPDTLHGALGTDKITG